MQESKAPSAPSQEGRDAARDTDRLDAGEVGTVSALELLQGSKRADLLGAAHVRRLMLRSMPHIGALIRYVHSNPCTSWHFHVSSARVATSLEASGTLNIVRAAWSSRKNTLAWRLGNDLSQRDLSRRSACNSPLQADIRRAISSLRFSGWRVASGEWCHTSQGSFLRAGSAANRSACG
jgi:hypothetical protein